MRSGQSHGNRVDHSNTAHVDTGVLALTTKQMHFAGQRKAFRVPYEKIASFEPYSDGIKIIQDHVTAKPQFFITQDGWFAAGVIEKIVGPGRASTDANGAGLDLAALGHLD